MGMEQFCCPTSVHVCCIKKYSTKTWPHRGAISLLLKKGIGSHRDPGRIGIKHVLLFSFYLNYESENFVKCEILPKKSVYKVHKYLITD